MRWPLDVLLKYILKFEVEKSSASTVPVELPNRTPVAFALLFTHPLHVQVFRFPALAGVRLR
jgi:hypothetical protein